MKYMLARLINDNMAEVLPFNYHTEKRATFVANNCFSLSYDVIAIKEMDNHDEMESAYLCHFPSGRVTVHITLQEAIAVLLKRKNIGWIEQVDGDCLFEEDLEDED